VGKFTGVISFRNVFIIREGSVEGEGLKESKVSLQDWRRK
jgi:hypothetical protein